MGTRRWQIGIFGTFDVENYGDLLFPLLAERELGKRLGDVCLRRFSYHRKAAHDWPYEVTSLTELPAVAPDLDGVLIGGGHLIRFDKYVAPGYGPPSPSIHHPTGYWLTPALVAHQFGIPVAWNAPGAYGPVPDWAGPLMQLAFGLSRYVAVRDEAARAAVAPFAGGGDVSVIPDTAFGVAGLLPPQPPSVEFAALREALGLTYPYLVVQGTTGLDAFTRLVRDHPHAVRGYKLVVVPVGPVLGDAVEAGAALPGVVRVRDWPRPLALAELIGRADGVVGSSMHLAITALACGTPVFRPARLFDGKYAVLSAFDTVHAFEDSGSIDPDWFTERLGRRAPSAAAQAAAARVADHWDHVARVFRAHPRSAGPGQAVSRFWQASPHFLEQRAAG